MSQKTKKTFVQDFVKGSTVSDVFWMSSIAKKETKAGKPYWVLELADRSGSITANVWDASSFVNSQVLSGQGMVKVKLTVEEYSGKLQGVVKAIKAMDTLGCDGFQLNEADFVCSSPYDSKEQMRSLRVLVDEHVQHPGLLSMCQEVLLRNRALADAFQRSPAAKGNHHGYMGGLLDHCLSMSQIAVKLSEHYSMDATSTSLLIAAVLFHDIGKIEELDITYGGAFYTTRGSLIGHVSIGLQYIQSMKSVYEVGTTLGPPPVHRDLDVLFHLEHIVASHHGKKEWGAAQVPMTREAQLFHLIDMIDSRMGLFDTILKESPDSEGFYPWSKQVEGRPWSHRAELVPAIND